MDDELLTLSQDVEAAQYASRVAGEALKEEHRGEPERIKEAIVEYKKSTGFELGLQRSGQVTYEFGYRVAFARFHVKYPNLDLKSDSFTDLPKD